MQKLFRILGVLLIIIAICCISFYFWLTSEYVVPIMMYHRVAYDERPHTVTLSPETFRYHMEFLKKQKYNVISFEEYINGKENGTTFPRNTVVITFDDGYEDNYTYAYKVLKEYGFSATMFVSSHFVGQEGYFDWTQIKEMNDNKIIFGSHTRRHAYLPEISEDLQWEEVTQSKKRLQDRLGVEVKYFSYPVAGFSDTIKEFVKKAGYKAACTTNRGWDKYNIDLYELKRIRFGDSDNSDLILWAKLSGHYNRFRKLESPN